MADWTTLVFLNAKNDLEPYSFKNFEQMAGVGSQAWSAGAPLHIGR